MRSSYMEEIKINDYVRIKGGYIGKIININDFREPVMRYGVDVQGFDDIIFIGDNKIVKHSKNIIDLLEVGDIVKLIDYGMQPGKILVFHIPDKNYLELIKGNIKKRRRKTLRNYNS